MRLMELGSHLMEAGIQGKKLRLNENVTTIIIGRRDCGDSSLSIVLNQDNLCRETCSQKSDQARLRRRESRVTIRLSGGINRSRSEHSLA